MGALRRKLFAAGAGFALAAAFLAFRASRRVEAGTPELLAPRARIVELPEGWSGRSFVVSATGEVFVSRSGQGSPEGLLLDPELSQVTSFDRTPKEGELREPERHAELLHDAAGPGWALRFRGRYARRARIFYDGSSLLLPSECSLREAEVFSGEIALELGGRPAWRQRVKNWSRGLELSWDAPAGLAALRLPEPPGRPAALLLLKAPPG